MAAACSRESARIVLVSGSLELEGAIALQLVMGKFFEATVIGVLLVFNAGLSSFQEGRAQATLAALKLRLEITASVRREGIWKLVPAPKLVPVIW